MLPFASLSVAPMEGLTTFPMRLWLHIVAQPKAMTTPFLRVTQVHPEGELPASFAPELFELRGVLPYELVPQFISGDPQHFLRAADLLPPTVSKAIELNCGCPSPNSMGRYAGSGILQEPEYFARSLEEISARLGAGRFAVKMRLGIHDPAEFPTLLQAVAALPLARLTVHGRTRRDGYRGQARWEAIQSAARLSQSPVLASGDIWGLRSLEGLREKAPDIAGAMIGRGVLRNPWVFEEFRTGRTTRLPPFVLANALFCYALLQDLWQQNPRKLIARIASGRIGSVCGTDADAWERLTVELSSLVLGCPRLSTKNQAVTDGSLSPVAANRLKFLWSYLRSGLPEPFADPRLLRSKGSADFFATLWNAAEEDAEIEIGHQEAWDRTFQGLRG